MENEIGDNLNLQAGEIILSVIILVFNGEKYISDCLDSLTRQNFNSIDYEIIVVNDGSTDGTMEIIKRYTDKYDYIHCFDKVNGGVSSARNFGIKVSRGKYITFVDADDYVVNNFYINVISCIEKDSLDEFIFNSTSLVTDLDNFSGIYNIENHKRLPQTVWKVIYKREIIEKYNINFIEEISYNEDVLFNYMYGQCTKIIGFSKNKVIYHRIHDGSVSRQLVIERSKKRTSCIQEKQYYSSILMCKKIKEYKDVPNFSQDFYEIALSSGMSALIWGALRTKIKPSSMLVDLELNNLSLKDFKIKIIEGTSRRFKLKSHIEFACRKIFWLKLFYFIFRIFD